MTIGGRILGRGDGAWGLGARTGLAEGASFAANSVPGRTTLRELPLRAARPSSDAPVVSETLDPIIGAHDED
jgi:hypothetical protein